MYGYNIGDDITAGALMILTPLISLISLLEGVSNNTVFVTSTNEKNI